MKNIFYNCIFIVPTQAQIEEIMKLFLKRYIGKLNFFHDKALK